MTDIVDVRNYTLRNIETAKALTSDFKSKILDFKEMNVGAIQTIVTGADVNDGSFSLEVSLLCDPTTFITYPGSERSMSLECSNFGWSLDQVILSWRYFRVCYTRGSDTMGAVDIWARGKRT